MSRRAENIYTRVTRGVETSRLRTGGAVRRTTDGLRGGRRRAAAEFDGFDALRAHGEKIRAHTIDHLDYYLAQLAARVREAGGRVFFARTAREAGDYVLKVAADNGVKTVAKSKSMLSEEIELNRHLEARGIDAVETDLGEYIIQVAGDTPSHLIAPALHMSRDEVAALFGEIAGQPLGSDTPTLTAFARARLREAFLSADMGVTGCNFAVAETGSLVLVTNEGNGRMVTSLPKVQVTLMGMERIVPTMDDLDVMLDLLARSATGQKISTYTTMVTGPRREGETDGPEQLHLVIIDNGRSNLLGGEYQAALHCIRCGACQNVCPVYRHAGGGHAYGWVYGGPIGAVITPLLRGVEQWGEVAQASSLCAACTEVCPVNIPLHDMLIDLRRDTRRGSAEKGGSMPEGRRHALDPEAIAFRAWRNVVKKPGRFRLTLQAARVLQKPFVKDGHLRWGPPPVSGWLRGRDMPALAAQSFRDWWRRERASGADPKSPAAEN